MEKIIRSICIFSPNLNKTALEKQHHKIAALLEAKGFRIQTQRLCFKDVSIHELEAVFDPGLGYLYALGSLGLQQSRAILPAFIQTELPISFNLQLDKKIGLDAVQVLLDIVHAAPHKTFNFCYSFHPANNSPFFPSVHYKESGFSIGLQSTNLAHTCANQLAWFGNMKKVWTEIETMFCHFPDYLGIDSSVAPLFDGPGSFMGFALQQQVNMEQLCTSDFFTQVSNFIKRENPRPVGLCGLMFPCLEDFVLADCYERGAFSLERNIFLSLHSGIGIDTYPIGVDECPQRIHQVLLLVQALSNKYQKPLSVRFVSDGKRKIGEMSSFKNPYLKEVKLRRL